MKTHEFDRTFDDGEDVSAHVDWAGARRVNLGTRRLPDRRDPAPETC